MSPLPQSFTGRPLGYVRYWYQVDSRTAIPRSRLSGKPLLQAAHWKISSVVPETDRQRGAAAHVSHLAS